MCCRRLGGSRSSASIRSQIEELQLGGQLVDLLVTVDHRLAQLEIAVEEDQVARAIASLTRAKRLRTDCSTDGATDTRRYPGGGLEFTLSSRNVERVVTERFAVPQRRFS